MVIKPILNRFILFYFFSGMIHKGIRQILVLNRCNSPHNVFFVSFRGEEDESLAIKPPQQIARKDKSHHRKEEKRKDKRRHRSHSAEGGSETLLHMFYRYIFLFLGLFFHVCLLLKQQENMHDSKIKKKSAKAIAGNVTGKRTKPGETGKGRKEGNRPELIHVERGEHQLWPEVNNLMSVQIISDNFASLILSTLTCLKICFVELLLIACQNVKSCQR